MKLCGLDYQSMCQRNWRAKIKYYLAGRLRLAGMMRREQRIFAECQLIHAQAVWHSSLTGAVGQGRGPGGRTNAFRVRNGK
jgi:hypothetical protein